MSNPPNRITQDTRTIALRALTFATLLGVLAGRPAADEALGRLFFTPERRQNLDLQRKFNIQDKQQMPEEPTLTVNGMVTRSSGKRTAWINGIPQNENQMQGKVDVIARHGDPGRVVVHAGDTAEVSARVGETVNRSTGETSTLLNDGSITLPRPRSAQRK